MKTTATHVQISVKYDGICPICGRSIGGKKYQLAEASLYRVLLPSGKSKFFTVHTSCAGGSTKTAPGGVVKYRTRPREAIDVTVQAQLARSTVIDTPYYVSDAD